MKKMLLAVFVMMSCFASKGWADGMVRNDQAIMFVLDISGSMSGRPLKDVRNVLKESLQKHCYR